MHSKVTNIISFSWQFVVSYTADSDSLHTAVAAAIYCSLLFTLRSSVICALLPMCTLRINVLVQPALQGCVASCTLQWLGCASSLILLLYELFLRQRCCVKSCNITARCRVLCFHVLLQGFISSCCLLINLKRCA
jgi:hypothetical protein